MGEEITKNSNGVSALILISSRKEITPDFMSALDALIGQRLVATGAGL